MALDAAEAKTAPCGHAGQRLNQPLQWTGPGVGVAQAKVSSGRPRPLNGVALGGHHMNVWPFRRQPKKPKLAINLHGSVQNNATVAAAWTTYAGTKALLRTGEYVKLHPEALGHDSPFDEECYAHDAMAEFWAVQPEEKRRVDAYLQSLANVRGTGFIPEYVWRFLREPSWREPAGLRNDAFSAWAAESGLAKHRPPTLAFVSGG